MILHPGIIALFIGSFIAVSVLLYGSFLGFRILRRWDRQESSEEQLSLERRTYLVSTMMKYVFWLEILSALLFILTVDSLHTIFTGAMCATGSLNANPVGWKVLYLKISMIFLSGVWITMNDIDQRTEDLPLLRLKYGLLFFILPVVVAERYLEARYFLGLNPEIITSCCGSLFSEEGGGLPSTLSTLPIRPTMVVFFSTVAAVIIIGLLSVSLRRAWLRYLFSAASVILFPVSLAAVVSFISLYFYEVPTHHCPFDILQAEYHYIGYPLYVSLFGGSFFGMIVGITEPLRRLGSLDPVVGKAQQRWTVTALVLVAVFTMISLWPMLFSSFTLKGYL